MSRKTGIAVAAGAAPTTRAAGRPNHRRRILAVAIAALLVGGIPAAAGWEIGRIVLFAVDGSDTAQPAAWAPSRLSYGLVRPYRSASAEELAQSLALAAVPTLLGPGFRFEQPRQPRALPAAVLIADLDRRVPWPSMTPDAEPVNEALVVWAPPVRSPMPVIATPTPEPAIAAAAGSLPVAAVPTAGATPAAGAPMALLRRVAAADVPSAATAPIARLEPRGAVARGGFAEKLRTEVANNRGD